MKTLYEAKSQIQTQIISKNIKKHLLFNKNCNKNWENKKNIYKI